MYISLSSCLHDNWIFQKYFAAMFLTLAFIIFCIGAANSAAVTKGDDCPTICPASYQPVCGSDGKTYPNACALSTITCKNATITMTNEGPCPGADCDEFCPATKSQVCANDGLTYDNECFMRVANCRAGKKDVVKNHDGECRGGRADDCPTFCTLQFEPVCGSDGKTYDNKCKLLTAACQAGNAALVEAHKGSCSDSKKADDDCPTFCTADFRPVCGSDGKTYGNLCALTAAACKDASIKMAKEGECGSSTIKDDVECPIFCTQQYQPVCGSDGKTYGNACELKAATCKDSSIKQVNQGECTAVASDVEGKLLCGRKCEEENDPICGSDGITYASSCMLSWESCNKGLSVEPLHKGACGSISEDISCDKVCPLLHAPVCGSDGTTYSNECQLDVHNCQRKKDSDGSASDISILKKGSC